MLYYLQEVNMRLKMADLTPYNFWSSRMMPSTTIIPKSVRNVTQIMPLHYQVCLVTRPCYIPGADSWWITLRITARHRETLSAVSAVIDLPSRERLILEAGFSYLPQHHTTVCPDWSLHHLHRRDHHLFLPTPAGISFPAKILLPKPLMSTQTESSSCDKDSQNCPIPTFLNEIDVTLKSNTRQM